MKSVFLSCLLGILFVNYTTAQQPTIPAKADQEKVQPPEINQSLMALPPIVNAKDFVEGVIPEVAEKSNEEGSQDKLPAPPTDNELLTNPLKPVFSNASTRKVEVPENLKTTPELVIPNPVVHPIAPTHVPLDLNSVPPIRLPHRPSSDCPCCNLDATKSNPISIQGAIPNAIQTNSTPVGQPYFNTSSTRQTPLASNSTGAEYLISDTVPPGMGQINNLVTTDSEAGCPPVVSSLPSNGCLTGAVRGTNYLSAFGGWANQQSLEWTDQNNDHLVSCNDGWAIGGAMGRRINNRWRSEVEWVFRSNTNDMLSINQGAATDVTDHLNSYTTMRNVVRELGCGKFVPYVGGGVGICRLEGNILDNASPGWRVEDTMLAFQFIAGLNIQVNQRAQLYSEYRYFGTTDATVFEKAGLTAVGETSYDSQNIFFGIRLFTN